MGQPVTDAGTEMIYPLLPVYLSRVLRRERDVARLIEGVAEGINSLAEGHLRLLVPTVRGESRS
jgi:hypothetical protein